MHTALRVIAPTLRLNHTDQQLLMPYVRVTRYGADEVIQQRGQVPSGMTFIVDGRVTLATTTDDGVAVHVRTLERGDFLGQTALTREPVIAGAYALDEVTVLQLDRERIEALVLEKPVLLQEIGRAIEERRANVRRAVAAVKD